MTEPAPRPDLPEDEALAVDPEVSPPGRRQFPLPLHAVRVGRHPMLRLVLGRLLAGVALLWAVSVLIFFATQILPGDAASVMLGRYATPESLKAVREDLKLDDPLVVRYVHWIGDLVRGDLGQSYLAERPVSELISDRLKNTGILALVTTAFMLPLALGLGAWTGFRAGKASDHAISTLGLVFIAIPDFVIGALLALVFAIGLNLLPAVSLVEPGVSPLRDPEILVLPVVTLLVATLAYSIRMLRASVADVMGSDYVQMARLNGLPERTVITKYALRNSLAPSLQVIAFTILAFAGGVVTVEYIFAYPGIGAQMVSAVGSRDLPLVEAIAMIAATLYVVVMLIADLLVIAVVPKLRTAQWA